MAENTALHLGEHEASSLLPPLRSGLSRLGPGVRKDSDAFLSREHCYSVCHELGLRSDTTVSWLPWLALCPIVLPLGVSERRILIKA